MSLVDDPIGQPSLDIISIDWAQLSSLLHGAGERIQSPKRCVL
jgi:hypothetical protein